MRASPHTTRRTRRASDRDDRPARRGQPERPGPQHAGGNDRRQRRGERLHPRAGAESRRPVVEGRVQQQQHQQGRDDARSGQPARLHPRARTRRTAYAEGRPARRRLEARHRGETSTERRSKSPQSPAMTHVSEARKERGRPGEAGPGLVKSEVLKSSPHSSRSAAFRTAVPSEPFARIRCYPLGRIGAERKTRNERKTEEQVGMEHTPQTPITVDVKRRRGPLDPPAVHHARTASVRRGRVGAAGRADRPRRQGLVRAARRRVPEELVAERDQHRRAEVLPRPARRARARALGQADDRRASPARSRPGAASAATSRPTRTPTRSRPS